MIRIQLGGTCDQLERMLMNLVEDWDEVIRWAVRNNYCDDRLKIARAEKERMLTAIASIREAGKAG